MALRDLVITVAVLGSLPFCFARPWIGILMWSWLGYMNLPSATWGFAGSVPFSLLVAMATLAGFAVTSDRKPFVWCRETKLLFALWGWFTVTTACALYPGDAWLKWEGVSKILLMALLTIPLFQDRHRLRLLLLVIAASFGYYGFKEGILVIATGGSHMVYGASGSTAVSTNNAAALALNMSLPLFLSLAREEPRRWLRLMLLAAFFLSILAVPFTFSRGGVLGLVAVLSVLLLGSRRKFLLIPAGLLAAYLFVAFAPQKVIDRMETVSNYEQDGSAMSRLTAWGMGIKIANDRPLVGGGFDVFDSAKTWAKYEPKFHHASPGGLDAHSIYFNLLGEHGYVGLSLFIVLSLSCLSTVRKLKKLGRRTDESSWISNYAQMLEATIVAYLVTGTFMSVAYFDFAYHIFALVVILRQLAVQELLVSTVRPVQVSARRRDANGLHAIGEGCVVGMRPAQV